VDPTEKSKRIDPQIKEKTAQLEYRNMKEVMLTVSSKKLTVVRQERSTKE